METAQIIHVRQNGYTLIEMLVVIFIISIIVPALFLSIQRLYETHGQTLSRAFAVVETSKAVKETVRDIRSAVYAENGALPLVTIATSTFTFYSDTDFDGDVERVRYFLSGNSVQKGVIEPTATSSYPESTETIENIITTVTNPTTATPLFRYYSATSSEITSASSILEVRRVEVEYIGSVRTGGEVSDVAMRSSASIRNLKDTY